jgi:hypothetical protein
MAVDPSAVDETCRQLIDDVPLAPTYRLPPPGVVARLTVWDL